MAFRRKVTLPTRPVRARSGTTSAPPRVPEQHLHLPVGWCGKIGPGKHDPPVAEMVLDTSSEEHVDKLIARLNSLGLGDKEEEVLSSCTLP